MNINQVSEKQIQERVQELVASVEQYARLSRVATGDAYELHGGPACAIALDMSQVTVSLASELSELLGKGRLEVSRG